MCDVGHGNVKSLVKDEDKDKKELYADVLRPVILSLRSCECVREMEFVSLCRGSILYDREWKST